MATANPFIPKSVVCFREGYDPPRILADVLAGITVGFVAVPLAMALAIASGVKPEQGLTTAVIAGFLISALGGSRVQIGGPTGAFVVIVLGIVRRHGVEGLTIATLMAGLLLIVFGLARLGGVIKFIPYPVTTGFTSGIALLIFSQQMRDLFGLRLGEVPGEFVSKWIAYVHAAPTVNPWSAAIGAATIALLIGIRRVAPRVPGPIVALVFAGLAVWLFDLDARHGVETIGSRFGDLPRSLPAPTLPALGWHDLARARELVPEAVTIALLAAIESLLCAVVADGMIGGRHRSNGELVAQGIANVASALFGDIPATGAIARTATNVKAGGRTPLAGMVHALTILVLMLALAPLARRLPLSALAAILVVVAWNMAEIDHFRHMFKAPRSDLWVLLVTFGLTVLADLTAAVLVGMVLASMLFMRRMAEVTNVGMITRGLEDEDEAPDPGAIARRDVPSGVEVFEIDGPFFFAVADRLKDVLSVIRKPPAIFILRMRRVPAIDATGIHALEELHQKCRREGTLLLLAGVHAQPLDALMAYGLYERIGEDCMFGNVDDALDRARALLALPPAERPLQAPSEVAREEGQRR